MQLNCREVILDDMNISKAIVDFLVQHGVDKLVLGASCRNAFSRYDLLQHFSYLWHLYYQI